MNDTPSPKPQPQFEQFTAIRRYRPTLALAPDGSAIAYSINTSGQFNLWVQPIDGGCPRQLTLFTDQTVGSIAWSPDGKTIAFHADRDGNEFNQIYTLPVNGGWPTALTDTLDAQHYVGDWASSGEYLAYTANDRERTQMDVVIRNTRSGETQRVTSGGLYFFGGWSPDVEQMLAVEFRSNTDQNIYLVAPGDTPQLLTPHNDDAIHNPVGWTADSASFYFISDHGREFKGLARYDVAARSWQWVETPAWDVEEATLSKNGQQLAWTVNEDGYSVLYVRDLRNDTLLELPTIPHGVISTLTISDDGRRVAFLLARATQATAVVVVDVATQKLYQLGDGFLAGIDADDLIEPELVRFPSFDGRHIPAFLYRPKGAVGQHPVVLSIHGGPEAQERPVYGTGIYQYLLSRGIGVLATNIRGSTGYGKGYQKLIHRDWGGGDLKDFAAAVDYLRSLDWVDGARIGVFGGSYGGFATLSCVSRLPDVWAVAAEVVGPSNLITFVQSVPPWWRSMMDSWVGNPEADREMLIERSPITYVDQIRAPLFIIQGAKDPRVVKAESDQIVERLRSLNRTVRYDVYEDEGHGFTRRANELKAFKDVATWLEQYLLPADEAIPQQR